MTAGAIPQGGPTLSIVIATYNCADTLQACLDSIHAQSWPGIEIVVADGGSTDGTVELIRANADRLGPWVSEPDRGIYDAWNKALELAGGDWIHFLGGDDRLHARDSIARAMTRIADLPDAVTLAYGQVRFVRADGSSRMMGAPWETLAPRMQSEMSLPHQGIFHARRLFDRHGGFDDGFRIAGDYNLIMRAVAEHPPAYLGDVVIADQHAGGTSGLRRSRIATLREFRRVQRALGLPVRPRWVWAYAKGLGWRALSRFIDVGAGA